MPMQKSMLAKNDLSQNDRLLKSLLEVYGTKKQIDKKKEI